MLITTKAIVISSLKYAEADLIVKCFTEKSGLKSYLLRNILKSKKGKLRTSMFQPLTQLEIVANHKDKNTLEHIREAKVVFPYQNLPQNVYKSSVVMFLAETLRNSVQEEEANVALYGFLEKSFVWLDKAGEFSNFHLLFLVKLTRFLGFYPHFPQKNEVFFNLLEGVFQERETDRYCLGEGNSKILKRLLNLKYDENNSLKLNRTARGNFLGFLLFYYELHLQGFRKPKSLEVLQQLFSN